MDHAALQADFAKYKISKHQLFEDQFSLSFLSTVSNVESEDVCSVLCLRHIESMKEGINSWIYSKEQKCICSKINAPQICDYNHNSHTDWAGDELHVLESNVSVLPCQGLQLNCTKHHPIK